MASRRDRQRRRNRHRGHGSRRVLAFAFGLLLLGIVGGGLGVVGWVVNVADSAPSINQITPKDSGSVSTIYAADGSKLGYLTGDVIRVPVPGSKIPNIMRQATISIEDQRYYQHGAIDYWGVIRAAVADIATGKTVQGGSTITMQLVKNLYLSDAQTYSRKIKEAKLAEEMESKHSKRWILNKYLNEVPYGTVGGQNAVGVEAGSWMFFDRPVQKLKVRQAALLAGLPQAPTSYNPFLHPKAARQRRNEVLRKMAQLGYITKAHAQKAMSNGLGVHHSNHFTHRRFPYFMAYVRKELIARYGVKRALEGGLKVYTTLNPSFQKAAIDVLHSHLPTPGDPSSAAVTIDPSTGDILVMANSTSYADTKFNDAAQAYRQPGSSFKTMVLLAAIRQGMNPNATYYVSRHLMPGWLPSAPTYEVQTFEHTYSGRISVTEALVKSDNTVFAQLGQDVGMDKVVQTAYDMGIPHSSHLHPYAALALGGLTRGVTPLAMATAYATIADGGVRNRPHSLTKVVFPDGHVDRVKPDRKKEFTDGQTSEAIGPLSDNLHHGTGAGAGYSCPGGGKTGTTENFKDAWFVGFTPKYSTAVWMGYAQPRPMYNVEGVGQVQGASIAAPMWGDIMRSEARGYCGDFPQPTQPFQAKPWFGHYATTGTSSDHNYTSTGPSSSSTGGYQGNTGNYNNPNAYETPPQTDTTTTPATPTTTAPATTTPTTPTTTTQPPAPPSGGTTTPGNGPGGTGPPGQTKK